MKYLKKIFENDNSIRMLLNAIDAYNDRLIKDKEWKKYYQEVQDWRKSDSKDTDFLEEVIKFAEKRIEEIKAEFQKDIDFVKDLYLNYLEDCQSFSDYLIRRISDSVSDDGEYGYLIELKLTFSKESLQKRKYMKPEGYKITCDEVLDYWKNIYDFFVVLESNEYIPRIKYYQPNGVEFIIIIGKQ